MKRSTEQDSSQSEGNDFRLGACRNFILGSLLGSSRSLETRRTCSRKSFTNFVCACALFGAFAVIKIFPARFIRISTGRSTPFCHIFWRGIKDCDKFTNISNSVDTLGVC